ncbi:MAG TPA: holo-ACP synthase [Alphaproteobacteria bacterium]|nr:holo-ACP synthase [Alphaproteobacteria bacterium]
MILGIGQDLVDIPRIAEVHRRYGARFLQRIFTPVEQAKAASRAAPAPTLAKRFAAKEAMAKALGTGMAQGVAWRQIGVVNKPGGQPEIELQGAALARLHALTPRGLKPRVHLTLTDEGPQAQALVIITADPH